MLQVCLTGLSGMNDWNLRTMMAFQVDRRTNHIAGAELYLHISRSCHQENLSSGVLIYIMRTAKLQVPHTDAQSTGATLS